MSTGRIVATRGHAVSSGSPLLFGKIRKGGAKVGNRPGPDLDYFRVDFEPESPLFDAAEALQLWQQLYGDQPQILNNVQFLSDSPDVLKASNELWGRGANGAMCTRRCDGATVTEHMENSVLSRTPLACNYPICGGARDSRNTPVSCKLSIRLFIFLPEFCQALGVIGQFMLLSSSRADYEKLSGTIDSSLRDIGRLRNIAFTLYRQKRPVRQENGLMVEKSLVMLDLAGSGAQLLAQRNSDLLLTGAAATPPELPAAAAAAPADTFRNVAESGDDDDPEAGWTPLKPMMLVVEWHGRTWYRFQEAASGMVYQTDDAGIFDQLVVDVNRIGEAYPPRKEPYILLTGIEGQGRLIGDTFRLTGLRPVDSDDLSPEVE